MRVADIWRKAMTNKTHRITLGLLDNAARTLDKVDPVAASEITKLKGRLSRRFENAPVAGLVPR